MSYDHDTITISLQVRYHGIKATQYFSKWSDESVAIFRDDLTTLKVPHPKRDNIQLVSHACVRGFWPAAQRDGLLQKQLSHLKSILTPSNPELSELSISIFSIKFGLDPAVLANPLKRSFHSTYADYADKRPRLEDQADARRPNSRFSQVTFPAPLSLPSTLGSSPAAVSATRFGAFHSGSVGVNNLAQNRSIATRPNSKPIPTQPSLKTFRESSSTSLNAHTPTSTSGSTPTAVYAARVNPPSSSGNEVANNVTNGALPNPVSQNTIARAAHATASSAAGPNSSARSSSIITLTQGQYLTREQIIAIFKAYGKALPEEHPYLTSQKVTLAEIRPILAPLVRAHEEREEQIRKIKEEVQNIRNAFIAQRREEEHALARLHKLDQKEAQALSQVIPSLGGDESCLKEQIGEGLAALKEAQEQISKLTTQLQGEQTLRANAEKLLASTQQELQNASKRLSQSKTNLEVEQTKRKDAEDAIQDIRRECRSPFIVPSLLDAFVELSRMTTKATIAPPPESATQHPPKDAEVHSPEARVKQEPDYWIA